MTKYLMIRITPAVAADLENRDLAESYDGPANPYTKIIGEGRYEFSRAEAAELLAEAAFYADEDGPGESLGFGTRMAYGLLVRRLRDAGVTAADHAPELAAAPQAPRPRPALRTVALGEVRPGNLVEHPILGSCIVAALDRLPATRRHPECVALRVAGEVVFRSVDDLVTTR